MKRNFLFAACQLPVSEDKEENVRRAVSAISVASSSGAAVVALPEMWNTPYATKNFPRYSETIPGPTCAAISEAARSCGCYVIAGSIPERDGALVFNTSVTFDPRGEVVAKHRKVHLFEVDAPGITFHESETLAAGANATSFDTPFGSIGVAICFDVRFPELARHLVVDRGCGFLVFPGAFNMTTGPAHWDLLLRARAVDNQCFVAAVAPARDASASYVSWANSMIVDPWGRVVAAAAEGPETISATIDFERIASVRKSLPVLSGRREDLYMKWHSDLKKV